LYELKKISNFAKNIIKMKNIGRGVILAMVLLLSNVSASNAQCPMCRLTLESNLQNGGAMGKGINAGIFLLLATPYLLVGGIAFVWWRNRKKPEEQELEEELAGIA
jgi:hypothetical protein